MFGDSGGWLMVCDSTSGDSTCRWRGHCNVVLSLAIRGDDRILVSGSWDGTIAQWEATSGREIGNRVAVGGGKVYSVAVSRDGKRIAYCAFEKVGVLNADTGDVLREFKTDWIAYCGIFGSDDETVHFGRGDGTTVVLAPDSKILCYVKAHSSIVFGIAQSQNSRRLVSVSRDCTLSVQDPKRLDSSHVANPETRAELSNFIVLPERKHVLYNSLNGLQVLKLLNLSTTSPEAVLSEEGLVNASATIGSADAGVYAIAVSRDGCWAVTGTREGELYVYETDTWSPRCEILRRLYGAAWAVAISNDSTFIAAGSKEGDVALFRSVDWSEVRLPSSSRVGGRTAKWLWHSVRTAPCSSPWFVTLHTLRGRLTFGSISTKLPPSNILLYRLRASRDGTSRRTQHQSLKVLPTLPPDTARMPKRVCTTSRAIGTSWLIPKKRTTPGFFNFLSKSTKLSNRRTLC